MPRRKKLNVKVEDLDSLQDLMQEVYSDACGQINDAQNGINNLSNSVEPIDTDEHVKVAKAKSDYLKLKDSAIKIKLDVGRLQNDILKNRGEVTKSLEELNKDKGDASLDTFSKLREMLNNKQKDDN